MKNYIDVIIKGDFVLNHDILKGEYQLEESKEIREWFKRFDKTFREELIESWFANMRVMSTDIPIFIQLMTYTSKSYLFHT